MAEIHGTKGPRFHHFLIWLFSIALSILLFWLLGFIIEDIGTLPGPNFAEVEKQFLDPTLLEQRRALNQQIGQLRQSIQDNTERQRVLRDSTNSSQQTMNQLLEFQRVNVQQGIKPSSQEQEALAEAESLFLTNQKRYQALNEQIAGQSEELRGLERKLKEADEALEKQRRPARDEYQRLSRRHDIKMASFKLAVLVPLLLGVGALFLKKRGSVYVPVIYASGLALVVKITEVMHRYFPSRYFKYILIAVLLAVVLRILVYLIGMIARPRKAWLLKQYREAYERFFCPVCGFPIRRGPLKYAFWTRRSVKRLDLSERAAEGEGEKTYSCPNCGTKVFEECPSCHAARHSLLPYCEKCGAEKEV